MHEVGAAEVDPAPQRRAEAAPLVQRRRDGEAGEGEPGEPRQQEEKRERREGHEDE